MAEHVPPREPSMAPAPLPLFREASMAATQDDLHELRVRIPVDLHRQLLSLKVLRGRSLAETVSMALDIYFSERANEARAHEATADEDAPAPT